MFWATETEVESQASVKLDDRKTDMKSRVLTANSVGQ